jgi:hypothetical protein
MDTRMAIANIMGEAEEGEGEGVMFRVHLRRI